MSSSSPAPSSSYASKAGGGGGRGGSNGGRGGGRGGAGGAGRGEGSRSSGAGAGAGGSRSEQSDSSRSPGQGKEKEKERERSSGGNEVIESKVGYIDTHCHYDRIMETSRHQGPVKEYLQKQAYPGNFEAAISIFCDPSAYSPSLAIWPDVLLEDRIYACFGIHPHSAKYYNDALEARIVEAVGHPKALAWGECGLDYHYDNSPRDVQRAVFARQILKAVELGKPLVVHSREAEQDTIEILKKNLPRDWKVHMHCHGGSDAFTLALLSEFPNMVFGFTGALTFPNAAQTRKVASLIPLERIVLETDGPYMAPNPHRGKTAHPGHIPFIAQQIAQIKGKSLDEVYLACREATRKMYGI